LDSAVLANLQQAMQASKSRQAAEQNLPTLTKAELAELLFDRLGLNKRE
jgi:integration host factor subunit alpha